MKHWTRGLLEVYICHHRATAILTLFFATVSLSGLAQSSSLAMEGFWHPDGAVYAMSLREGRLYLGGAFSYVGPLSGSAGVVSSVDASVAPAFPKFRGQVFCVVPDGSGGFYYGGKFFADFGQSNLVHVFKDLTMDVGFTPKPDDTVRALKLYGTNLFVGGDFQHIGGAARKSLAAVHSELGVASAWNPNITGGVVNALELGDGRLYVAGGIASAGGQARARMAAFLLADGSLLPWNPGVAGGTARVNDLQLVGDVIYVAGAFTTAGGKPRNRIAALDVNLDVNSALNWNPNAGDEVFGVERVANTVYLCGAFSSVGGLNRKWLAAVDSTSGLGVQEFNVALSAQVLRIVAGDGGLYLGGQFTTIGQDIRRGLAQVELSTGALRPWNPLASQLASTEKIASVRALALQNDRIAVGGDFVSLGGVNRQHLAALDTATGLATVWNPGADGSVYALASSPGAIYAGGIFTNVGGGVVSRLAALDPSSGQVKPFSAQVVANGTLGVFALVWKSDTLYVGGNFTGIGGTTRKNLAAVDGLTGALIAGWNPNSAALVRALALHGNDVLAGGDFASIGGANRVRLAQLNGNSGATTSFKCDADGSVRALFVDGDTVYVGGDFKNIGGFPRLKIAMGDATTGSISGQWNPDAGTARVHALSTSARNVYVGGNFTSIGGEFRTAAGAVTRSSGVAVGWSPNPGGGEVFSLVVTPERIYLGGLFSTLGGVQSPYFGVCSTLPTVASGKVGLTVDGKFQAQFWDGDAALAQVALQASRAVANPNWTTLETRPVTGLGWTFTDTTLANQPAGFYRIIPAP